MRSKRPSSAAGGTKKAPTLVYFVGNICTPTKTDILGCCAVMFPKSNSIEIYYYILYPLFAEPDDVRAPFTPIREAVMAKLLNTIRLSRSPMRTLYDY